MGIKTEMSKVAQYLNEHILGEVISTESIRKRFAHDGSVLAITPELVIYPRVTNDIRKVARFSWQLAEKGHVLPLTIRGGGTDQTGASIGKGIIIDTTAHLNKILHIALKDRDRFVHVQPGVRFKNLNDTLQSHGLTIPTHSDNDINETIGGAVANNSTGYLSGKYGTTGEYVTRLELILANGDIIETGRISRRDLDHKKGLQTFEGEIYRKIDGLIDDNEQLIKDSIGDTTKDNTGYPGIAKVKQRDGSFDLTPLIIGSQGTLGIMSEIVIKTEFFSGNESVIVAVFESSEAARDAADLVVSDQPSVLEFIDGELFNQARARGKTYPFFASGTPVSIGAVLYISFNDFSDGARKRKVKHVLKKISKPEVNIITSEEHSLDELHAIREVSKTASIPTTKAESLPQIIDGASIPVDRREEFFSSITELAAKHHVSLPVHIGWLDGIVHTRPALDLHKVSDKQKVFKLINDYAELVTKLGGNMSANTSEGRLRAAASYTQLDEDVLNLYSEIRVAFDPFGTLNPGVKQKSDLKTLAAALSSD
ncbi:MAG TPA: FAD-binding oxidoreductase [Candidatus Saccharimonadales bacterium]|nr:FAD-binding oxidoreductase [Candidatus Saccharimonadales bacterium]